MTNVEKLIEDYPEVDAVKVYFKRNYEVVVAVYDKDNQCIDEDGCDPEEIEDTIKRLAYHAQMGIDIGITIKAKNLSLFINDFSPSHNHSEIRILDASEVASEYPDVFKDFNPIITPFDKVELNLHQVKEGLRHRQCILSYIVYDTESKKQIYKWRSK